MRVFSLKISFYPPYKPQSFRVPSSVITLIAGSHFCSFVVPDGTHAKELGQCTIVGPVEGFMTKRTSGLCIWSSWNRGVRCRVSDPAVFCRISWSCAFKLVLLPMHVLRHPHSHSATDWSHLEHISSFKGCVSAKHHGERAWAGS